MDSFKYTNLIKKIIRNKDKTFKETIVQRTIQVSCQGIKELNLFWQDFDSSFNNRIRTGAIFNLKYKDPPIFLE